MSMNCDIILQWGATPPQLTALGAALWRWCIRTAGAAGIYQHLDNQALTDLIAGKLPEASQTPWRADGFILQNVTGADLQAYLDQRVRQKGKKSIPLRAATLRKEVASSRACFNWAVHNGLLTGTYPNRGLRFPKGEVKRPFLTREDIERRLSRGVLTPEAAKEYWNCLFLDLQQIDEFLAFVKSHGSRPWVYPMCAVAAHTGARRSELARLLVDDLDFRGKTVLVHERKRVRGQRTTRRVPLTPFLERVLLEWLGGEHPGGSYLFSQAEKRGHRPSEGEPAIPVAADDAGTHFQQTVKGSNWGVVRGWHTLRHSFASNLAAQGVDQRFIDEFMGHQTEAQRRRYRHLFPHQQRQVLCEVFGS